MTVTQAAPASRGHAGPPRTEEASPPQATGELRTTFGVRDDRTFVSRQYHRGALTLLRPVYLGDDGEATLTLINPGGGYLGGDRFDLEIEAEPGAAAVVTTQSATRVYRTPGDPARQHTVLKLAEGSCLTYVPDELIGYAHARYVQHTRAEVHPSATLFAKDVITPGWSPDGTRFRYTSIHAVFDVVDPSGRLLVRDNLLLEPGAFGLFEADGPMGPGTSHVGSLLVVSPHADAATVAEVRDVVHGARADSSVHVGVSALPVPGLIVRALGNSTKAVDRVLAAATDHLRAQWFARTPLHLRKY